MLDHLQSYIYCNYKGLRCNLHCNFEDYIVISRGHARFRIKYKDPWPCCHPFLLRHTFDFNRPFLSLLTMNKSALASKRVSKTAAASRGRKRSLEGGEETPNKKVH